MSLDCILTGRDGVLVIVSFFFLSFFLHIKKSILKPVIISRLFDV